MTDFKNYKKIDYSKFDLQVLLANYWTLLLYSHCIYCHAIYIESYDTVVGHLLFTRQILSFSIDHKQDG